MEDSSEHALMQEIARENRESFAELYRKWEKRVFAYLIRTIGDKETAEELLNDVMFAIWKHAGRFKGNSRLSTWIFGIAHNKAMNVLRKRGKRASLGLASVRSIPNGRFDPEQAAQRRDMRRQFREALGRLSPKHREVVDLTYYHGMSYPEIANVVKAPVATVKTRMFYAKQQLQMTLAKFRPEGWVS